MLLLEGICGSGSQLKAPKTEEGQSMLHVRLHWGVLVSVLVLVKGQGTSWGHGYPLRTKQDNEIPQPPSPSAE